MHSVYEREYEENIYTPNRKAGLGLQPEKTLKQTTLILIPDWPEFVYFLRSYDHIKKKHLNLNIFGGGKNKKQEI